MRVIEGQISLFDKPNIRFIKDNIMLNTKLIKGTEFEVYVEQ